MDHTIRWRGRSYPLPEAAALAAKEQQLGNLPAVADLYRLMLIKLPQAAELHNNRGAILQMLGQYDEALACYHRAIALKPAYANAYYNRAATLKKLGRHAEALVDCDQAIALNPAHVEAHHNRGATLQELRRYDEARASFDRAIALKPDHAAACNNRGIVFMIQGDMAGAEQTFRQALALNPHFADPWFNLVNIRKYYEADCADAQAIRLQLARPGIAPRDKEQLHFALGKIYDDCGRYDEAFASYRQANQLRNTAAAYNPEALTQQNRRIREVFNRDFLARPQQGASESPAPVFIVGMPRSGTTLLASILSNHPAIAMAGELPAIDHVTARLAELNGDGINYPDASQNLNGTMAARLVKEYEQRLRRDVGPEAPLVIDKNPLNFRHLGFISKMFPKARILHCTRHPLDTALSNYFQRFPLHLAYAFDLQNIGHFYLEYTRLMEHWRQVLPARILEISYQDMVMNTEAAARMALDYLGLDWDAKCLSPHTNPGPVETATQWQVRQPIYRQSLERWRHYEPHLAALKSMLSLA